MRLVGLTKDQLDAPQLALYEDITTGPRSSGPQHFPLTDSGGTLTGPFGIMLHQAALGRPLQIWVPRSATEPASATDFERSLS